MFNNKKKKILEKLRSNWTLPIDKFRNFDLISLYHDNVKNQFKEDKIVDENTWTDLNIEDIFSIIDRNSSPIGQQYLYHILRIYESDEEVLNHRFELAQYFKQNVYVREKIQLEFKKLDETNSNFIAPLLFGDLPERPKFYGVFYFFSYLAIISILFFLINPKFLFFTMGVFLINLIINHFYSKNIHQYFAGFSSLNSFLISVFKINKMNITDCQEFTFLKKKNSIIKKLNKKIGSLVLDKAAMNELTAGLLDYLNIYFLYDLIKFSRSVGLLKKYQKELQDIYNNVGEIDSAISLASYQSNLKYFCQPEFIEEKSISFSDLFHPLIVDAIPNSINKFEKSVLITGSNMAGKTTFIKTVGINIILAQTLNFCLSNSAKIPKLYVKSAIKREENLEDAKSYFFVEVEELQNFIQLSEVNSNYLFLIDEIFRGTNTIERLAASTSVLEYLNKNNFVFVTTHDIELQDLLNNQYMMFHFSERVNGKDFYFDYKLIPGPTSSGNAIKLLEIKGYPKSIIEKSRRISEELLSVKN